MSKNYVCDLCKKTFNQKIDYTRHINKKAPCISLKEMEQLTKTKEIKTDHKTILINVFKNCLNILRDSEGLTGEKALRNMSYFLILKLIEPHLDNEIDIENCNEYNFEYDGFDKEQIKKHTKKLFKIVRFSNLAKEEEDNIPTQLKYLWDDILSIHPSTKNIFLKGKCFDIERSSTYKKLIKKLDSFDLSETEYDVLGNAYEEVIQENMTGKTLGQFFTQPLIKKLMVNLIDPQIHSDGTIETCGDPAMGTGGFLITYLKYILEQAKDKKIKPNWNFIKTEGLYGKELEPDTYQLAVSNMLISSGHVFDELERGDSIRDPITRKFDNILANPPFGIKSLPYDDFTSSLKNEYTPIKSDNAVSLFIQAIIHMLKINGKCAVVLPDGQDLFSKSNKTLVAIREYLLKTCNLKEVIYLPSGIFTYTSIKTCVFYFIKKKEGVEVLETKSKMKSQKEIGKSYKFINKHSTKKVKFYDYNPYNDVKNLLVEVPINELEENSYSLNYAEYIKEEIDDKINENVIIKSLGEICTFQNGKSISKKDLIIGDYPVVGGGQSPLGYHNTYNIPENTIIISKDGAYAGYISKYDKKVFVSGHGIYISEYDNLIIKQEYVYYYLKIILQNDIYKLQTGTAQPGINKEHLEKLKIPVPSLEKQQEIVKYLDFIYEECIKTSKKKIMELKQLNEYCLNNQKLYGENEIKNLEDIFVDVKTGKDVVSDERCKGIYPFYGANGIIDYVDNYIFDGKYLLTARTGSLGSLHISDGKFWCSGDVHRMEFENETSLKYAYYYLKTVDFQKFRTGSAHPKLSGSSLKSIKLHLPEINIQKEIVEYCEYNDSLIIQLNKEINKNKIYASLFLSKYIRIQ
jgi:type I restriction enzyme S subunit